MSISISAEKLKTQLSVLLGNSEVNNTDDDLCLSRSILEDDFLVASKTAITRK